MTVYVDDVEHPFAHPLEIARALNRLIMVAHRREK
jgi:hypothetical protein